MSNRSSFTFPVSDSGNSSLGTNSLSLDEFLSREKECSDESSKQRSPMRLFINGVPINDTATMGNSNNESMKVPSNFAKCSTPMMSSSPIGTVNTTIYRESIGVDCPKTRDDFNDTIEWVDYCYVMCNKQPKKDIPFLRKILLQKGQDFLDQF